MTISRSDACRAADIVKAMNRRSVLQAIAAGVALAACGSTAQSGGTKTGGTTTATPTPGAKATQATVELAKGGSFTFTLRPDKARSGFYDNLTFHRVEDWVVQGGDPKGTGTGGDRVPSEYNDLSFKLGAAGIARGQDPAFNNDSQFFIVKKDSTFLDKQYTNFGQVTAGMDVVAGIKIGDKIKTIRIS